MKTVIANVGFTLFNGFHGAAVTLLVCAVCLEQRVSTRPSQGNSCRDASQTNSTTPSPVSLIASDSGLNRPCVLRHYPSQQGQESAETDRGRGSSA